MFDTSVIAGFLAPNLNKSVGSAENWGMIRLSGDEFSFGFARVLHWVLASNLVTDGYIASVF